MKKNIKRLGIILLIILLTTCVFYYFYQKKINNNVLLDKTSMHYVNSLYVSDGNIYEKYLTTKERNIYKIFLENIILKNKTVTDDLENIPCGNSINECDITFNKIYKALIVDHPEILSFASYSYEYDQNTDEITLKFDYALRTKLIDNIAETRINLILNKIYDDTKDLSDEDKILYVYDFIAKYNTYDELIPYSDKNQSIYNVLLKHNSLYSGYAKTCQVIFKKIGIESFIVFGKAKASSYMFNIVKYNDKYYYFDSTTGAYYKDKDNKKYYNGLKMSEMGSYEIDYDYWYPDIESTNMFDDSKLK